MAETPNPNSILKDTRESKGMTLEIVHEATKVPLDALKAIEQGYSVRSLTPFYYRGFIKIYAEFLGLDPIVVLKAYKMDQKIAPVVRPSGVNPATSTKPSSGAKKTASAKAKSTATAKSNAAASVNPLLDNLKDKASQIFKPAHLMIAGKVLGVLLVILLLFKIGGCAVNAIKHMPKSKPKAKVTATKTKQNREQAPKQVKETEQAITAVVPDVKPVEVAQDVSENINNKVELVARASRDTWIQVKSDGRVVFAMTMQKGTMETWTAKDQIELSGRNINLLEIEVNGKHIGQLGSVERRAKKVLITKEGLSVKK